MTTWLLLALGACVVPVDQAPGWKLAPVTHEAPALAAEGDVEQVRGGEEVSVVDRRPSLLVGADASRPGSMRFEVRLAAGATRATLDFTRSLQSAEVDVTAIGGNVELPLLQGKRIGGARVEVELPRHPVRLLRVVVHHHLRARPVLDVATVEWRGPANGGELPGTVPPGWLAYRHPGGRVVRLCNEPARAQRLVLVDDTPWALPRASR